MIGTFATHSGRVYDVTDTSCWAQNGGTHGRIFATFQRRIFEKKNWKSGEKTTVFIFLSFLKRKERKKKKKEESFLSVAPAILFRFGFPLTEPRLFLV